MILEQTFVLDTPPSTNNLFINKKGGGRFKAPAYADWLKAAGWQLNAQRAKHMPGRVKVIIRAIRVDNRRRDIDNIIKPVLDLLVKQKVIEDDRYVEAIAAEWSSSDLKGCSVTVVSLEAAEIEHDRQKAKSTDH